MTLDLTQLIFPNNAIELIATRMEAIDASVNVVRRNLRLSDPNLSVGVAATDWMPTINSMEMLGIAGTHESTLEQYMFSISAFVKHTDEQAGLIAHSVLSETIRTILAGDIPLRTQLVGLTSTLNGVSKRLTRFWVRTARFQSTKLQGSNLYLTVNDCSIEVERVSP